MGKRVPVRTKAKLRAAASEHMAMLEQNPEWVISYFQGRRVLYAGRLQGRSATQGRINNGHAGRGHLVQAGAEEPAIPDLRRSAVHEVSWSSYFVQADR